jgi:mannose-6-phosphate isomerase-like protein (cupin superfamily)
MGRSSLLLELSQRSPDRLLARPIALQVYDFPIVLLGVGEVGMAAFELGRVHWRLRDRSAGVLGRGKCFVHLLGSIDVDPKAEPAHALRRCSRFGLAVRSQLVPRKQRQQGALELEGAKVLRLDRYLPSQRRVEAAQPGEIASAERDDVKTCGNHQGNLPRIARRGGDACVNMKAGRARRWSRSCVLQARDHRITAVPFTLKNLKEDLEDLGSKFDGAPGLEFRLATKALELEQSGLSYQRVPPGYRFPYGHTHKKQEEVYVVVRGRGRMKLDDEIVELKEWDVVRVPPGMWRGYEAGPEGLEIIVIGAPNLGEAPREDVEGQRDWWAD